jgi:hypothetical protein
MRSKAALRFRCAVSSASRRAAPVSSGGASLAATIGGQLVHGSGVVGGVLAKSVIHGVYLVVGSE